MLHGDDKACSAVSAATVAKMSRHRILESETLSVSLKEASQRPVFVLGMTSLHVAMSIPRPKLPETCADDLSG